VVISAPTILIAPNFLTVMASFGHTRTSLVSSIEPNRTSQRTEERRRPDDYFIAVREDDEAKRTFKVLNFARAVK
jgi:hypothetical protein